MNRKLLIPILVVAALIGLAVYSSGMLHRDGSLHGSGTVEARNIRVGSKIGGRIDKVLVREGDPVEAGQVLIRSEEHTSELQSRQYLVCRLLLEKKKKRDIVNE